MEEKIVKSAGKPCKIVLNPDKRQITSNGKDLVYITVSVTDKDGNLCPHDDRLIKFSVKGNGHFRAFANGDPTSLAPFHLPQMKLFNGMLMAIVEAGESEGNIIFEAKASSLKTAKLEIMSVQPRQY